MILAFWISFFPGKNALFFLNIFFSPRKDDFCFADFIFFLVILPSCSKLCQSWKRQCGFVSPHATCCSWVVFFLYSHFLCLFVCVCPRLCLLFLFFVCCSCSLFSLVWWFVLFPKRLRPQWGKTPVKTVKKTGCIDLYWGVIIFFFLIVLGVGWERGGMVLLHVNDPPFFTTPPSSKGPNSSKASIWITNHVGVFFRFFLARGMKRGKWSKHQIGVSSSR